MQEKKLKVRLDTHVKTSVSQWEPDIYKDNFTALPYGFASEVLKDVYPTWTPQQAIILNLPTGRGKTTFTINNLVDFAKKRRIKILFASNRISLDASIKGALADKMHLYDGCTPKGLHDISEFKHVYVMTYHSLLANLFDKNFFKDFDYVVLDECHFFTSDATFSKQTDVILQKIPVCFSHAVRVYLSATPDVVMPYIFNAEFEALCPQIKDSFFNCEPLDMELAKQYLPLVYTMKADFSHIDLQFYTHDETFSEFITDSRKDKKAIIFVSSKKRGSELHSSFNGSLYMNADNYKNSAVAKDLAQFEKFDSNLLITTSVFCNGCNIKDSTVNTIFIECLDHTDILQMAGRRRKLSDDDKVTLYLKIPDVELLQDYIDDIDNTLSAINLGKTDPHKFINLSFDDNKFIAKAKKLATFCKDNTIHFNQIGIEQLFQRKYYYEKLIDLINNEGDVGYCSYISKTLFNKEYTQDMYVDWHDYKAETIEWLDDLVGKDLVLSIFREELCKRVEHINKKLKVRDDRKDKLQAKALNTLMEKAKLPFALTEKEGGIFSLVHNSNEGEHDLATN